MPSIRKQPAGLEEEEIPPEKMKIIRQMFAVIMKNLDAMAERMDQRFERMDQRLAKLERSDRFRAAEELPEKLHNEPQTPIEPPMEPPTLPPAKQATKPAPQYSMEPATPQPPPPVSEPSMPNVARIAKKHHTRHGVIERIGFRSPLASCSAFVHLGHLYPAASLLPFGSWTLTIFPRTSQ